MDRSGGAKIAGGILVIQKKCKVAKKQVRYKTSKEMGLRNNEALTNATETKETTVENLIGDCL